VIIDLNRNSFFKTLENDIETCLKDKKKFKELIRNLKYYLKVFYDDFPIQRSELLSFVNFAHQQINSRFNKTIEFLDFINIELKKYINNLYINIDTKVFEEQINLVEDILNDINAYIHVFDNSNNAFKPDFTDPNFIGPYNITPPSFNDVYENTNTFLTKILSHFENVLGILKDINNKISEIEKKVSEYSNLNFQKKLEEDTSLILKQFENQITNLIKTYENQIKRFNLEIKDSTDTVKIAKENLTDIELKNSDLSSKLSGYERRLQQIADSRTEDIQYVLEEKLVELERINNDKISVIDNSYEKAQTNYQKFKDLVEKAGVYNLITNYKKKAEDEQEEYKKYRDYTTNALYGAIGFTILILGIPLVEHWGDTQPVNIDYYPILVRLTISLMFLVLALFFSKQAAKHYECHQENNRTYLQLAALEPFMANMTPEDQLAIRKQLIPTYFNQNADGKFASKGDEVDISTNMHNLLSQVISVVAEKKDPKPSTNSSESNTSAK